MDEAYSAIVSSWPLSKIIVAIPGIGSPPLYNFFLHFWMNFLGQSEWILRFSSILLGVGSVLLLYHVGKIWFNKNVALLAAAVASINSLHIFYSQQVRVYAFLVFLSLLSAHWLYQFFKVKKWRYGWGYIFTLILLLYSHNWALFLIPIPYIFLFIHRPLWPVFPKLLLCHLVVLIGYAPFIPSLLAQTTSGSSSWILYFWEKTGPQWAFLKTFEAFFSGGEFMAFGKIPYGRVLPCLFLVFLLGYALVPKFKRDPSASGLRMTDSFSLKYLLCYLLVPILIPYLFSFYRPLYIPGRYDMIVFGAFCLLVAVGFSKMPKKILIPAFTVFFLMMSLNLGAYYFLRPPRQENKQMAELLKEKAKPDDLLLFTGLTRAPIQYYLGDTFTQFKTWHFPNNVENNFGYFDYPHYLKQKDAVVKEAWEWVQKIPKEKTRRIWVCSNRWLNFVFEKEANFMNEPLYEALFATCRLVEIYPFRKAFVLEFEPI